MSQIHLALSNYFSVTDLWRASLWLFVVCVHLQSTRKTLGSNTLEHIAALKGYSARRNCFLNWRFHKNINFLFQSVYLVYYSENKETPNTISHVRHVVSLRANTNTCLQEVIFISRWGCTAVPLSRTQRYICCLFQAKLSVATQSNLQSQTGALQKTTYFQLAHLLFCTLSNWVLVLGWTFLFFWFNPLSYTT